MLEGIIKFGGKTVEEVMTARVDITDIEMRTDFKQLLDTIIETGYSRLPVYDTTEDDIKGIIYSKDLLPYIGQEASFDWHKLMRRAYFVPETKMIDDLLEEFRTKKYTWQSLSMSSEAHRGIVTMEDILEEIVGDISDEYDEEEKNYTKIDENTYIFEGKILLNDFYKITGLDENEFGDKAEDAETLAGLILDIKEDFPKIKEQIDYGRCQFIVLELDKRRIGKVKSDYQFLFGRVKQTIDSYPHFHMRLNKAILYTTLFITMGPVIFSCHRKYTPLPDGYFRIDPYPEEYKEMTLLSPFISFEIPDGTTATLDKDTTLHKNDVKWLNIRYPRYRATIYCSYHILHKISKAC